jgi:aminopeptidase C
MESIPVRGSISTVVADAGSLPLVRQPSWSCRLTKLTAVANVLRYNVIEKLNLGDFQLSQNYLFFYDKLEKANYYLEYVEICRLS